jgi:hypothetical protein
MRQAVVRQGDRGKNTLASYFRNTYIRVRGLLLHETLSVKREARKNMTAARRFKLLRGDLSRPWFARKIESFLRVQRAGKNCFPD